MPDLPFAEDVNYFQTGRSSPDVWLARATTQIESIGGVVLGEGFVRDVSGRAAYMLAFRLGPPEKPENFRMVWPVLQSKSGKDKELVCRIQAATLLYHDVKARCMTAKVLGVRSAFFSYWLLPDGRSATEVAAPELIALMPKLLAQSSREEQP